MSTDRTEQFIDALRGFERTGEADPLVALFAADAKLQNVTVADDHEGQDGARAFWADDRKLFEQVESTFHNVIVGDERAALEWTRNGTARDGAPIEYDGVSVLEFGDRGIVRFKAYFHPRELGRQAT